MPQGLCVPLSEEDWTVVKDAYDDAVKNGLQYEWLKYFSGGISIARLDPKIAADEAAIEWDF